MWGEISDMWLKTEFQNSSQGPRSPKFSPPDPSSGRISSAFKSSLDMRHYLESLELIHYA